MSLISIILPVFNSSLYIEECINSILNQSFKNYEIVIVDDGSTDNTVELIQTFNNPQIKIIRNDHNFIQSLNKGIAEAKGKYLARMDADDWMFPNRLQVQYDFMENNKDIDICGSWFELFGAKKGIIKGEIHHDKILSSLILHNPLSHPSIIMRRELINMFSSGCLYNLNYPCAEDYKLWTDLAIKGARFAVIPEVLIKYRLSENQVTFLNRNKMKKTATIIQNEYINYILKLLQKSNPKTTKLICEINSLHELKVITHDCLQKLTYSLYSDFLKNQLSNNKTGVISE